MPTQSHLNGQKDASLFTAGALFTQDYLIDGITATAQYNGIDVENIRAQLESIFANFPHSSKPNEATTESDLIWPVLEALGWSEYLTQQNLSAKGRIDVPDGLLFIDADAKSKANEFAEEWHRYQFGAAVIESKRWARALDRAEGKSGDDKDTPSTQLLRYLRRIDDLTNGDLRWGLLTNGNKWRLYFAGARSTIDDYLEIDLARIMGPKIMGVDDDLLDTGISDDERDHWLAVFAAMFARTAFERPSDKAQSFHDRARRDAALYEERVAASLSELVFKRLYPMLGKAVAHAAPADTPLDEVRQATLILLYRLLFVLYAEDRGLLPVKDPRYDDYALRVSRLDVGKRKDDNDSFSSVAKTIWNRFADLSTMIDKGDASVGLPPYNGGLFNTERTPLLTQIGLSDEIMAEVLDILSFESQGDQRRYINYRDLSVQQLGSIYERLLEFELTRDDGIVDIRPNIFARKNSGSYYTPDDLVLLILDETLEPLIDDAMRGFQTALDGRDTKRPLDQQLHRLQKSDPAKAITQLRICDPAMGSGHFLVSLVDRLSNTALEAIAEAQVMAKNAGIDDYESPVAEEIQKIRGTIYSNAVDNGWNVTDEQLDDPQLIKRMVLKRCVYGADKNEMAVELAKVSLWLHSFTVGAPLSFIDHHLAAGDSLFGLWVRDAIDKAGDSGLFLHEPLREAEAKARSITTIEQISDADIGEAHESAKLWHDIESVTDPLDSFTSFMHALDWLAIGKKRDDLKAQKALTNLWLDGNFGEPIPIARGTKAPEPYRAKDDEAEQFTALWQEARALIAEENFLNWQIKFPGVWDNWRSAAREGGFDAVVGNPPWDRIKLQQVEWFAARRPAIAKAQRASDRKKMIGALQSDNDPLFDDYKKADKRAADTLSIARKSGHYPLLSRGDINLYSLFVERAHALVKPRGMVGLLTPSGIASDLSASAFFCKVATGGHLKSLYDFENRRTRYGVEPFFPDVDSRFKFAISVASPERTFAQSQCGFFLQGVNEIQNPDQAFPITAADFARVNPNTGTAPIFRTRRDMAITTAIYERCPVLVDNSGDTPVKAWPVKYSTMFHMTNDSHLFRTRAELEDQEGAWPIGGNKWESADGEWVPLYEGKMVQAYDHRAASVLVNNSNLHRPGQPLETNLEQHTNPNFYIDPQYWIAWNSLPNEGKRDYILTYKRIGAPTNHRTFIAALGPTAGYEVNASVIVPMTANDGPMHARLLACLNSIPFDFVVRQKMQGQTLNWYIVEQLPVIPPADYERKFGQHTAADIVKSAVLELTYTAHDMADFARDMGHVDADNNVLPPFIWDDERRLHLRAKLDALYFILYGVYDPDKAAQSRDDIAYIYSTFPIVERKETAQHGEYRSRNLCLSYINAIMAGQPDAKIAR